MALVMFEAFLTLRIRWLVRWSMRTMVAAHLLQRLEQVSFSETSRADDESNISDEVSMVLMKVCYWS